MKRKIAHIVNPFNASPSSDLHTAQPITFESMRIAKKKVEGTLDVELLTCQFEEDRNMIPDGFRATKDLSNSVLDYFDFDKKIKLPLISDIIERLYHESDADYLVYTNVDIGLYPDFYSEVNNFINAGYDAFIINRRRLSAQFKSVEDLPEIFNENGKKHPGFDCFVFHRNLYPKFQFEKICIGVPFIEITFGQNLFALANNFRLFDNEKLTFHIGMEIFRKRTPKEYFKFNQTQFWLVANSSLKSEMNTKKFPYSDWWYPLRIIRWGLHPCMPIRLIIKLEFQRLKKLFFRE